jgi:hypothetical protein
MSLPRSAAWPARSRYGLVATFSPDSKQLASTGRDGLWLWDAATGKRLHKLGSFGDDNGAVAFSPDGKQLASTGRDGPVLWDATTGERLHKPLNPGLRRLVSLLRGGSASPSVSRTTASSAAVLGGREKASQLEQTSELGTVNNVGLSYGDQGEKQDVEQVARSPLEGRNERSLPLTLDQALALGRLPEISNLLGHHLDAVATGSWEWLPELFALGFDAPAVAKLLLEQ